MARKRIEFWLDDRKPNEAWLLEQIPMLKRKWVFSRCMREGLELLIHFREWSIRAADVYDLIVDLRAGNLDKLLSMFPHVKTKLINNRTGDIDLAKEIAAQIILQGGSSYSLQSAVPQKPFLPPVAEVKQATTSVSADTIADNFLNMFQ